MFIKDLCDSRSFKSLPRFEVYNILLNHVNRVGRKISHLTMIEWLRGLIIRIWIQLSWHGCGLGGCGRFEGGFKEDGGMGGGNC